MLLEEGLLTEDPKSGEGRRMSVDSQMLKSQFGVTDALLRALENTYMIRKEPNSVGGESMEISHDTLVVPILKMKMERRSREELENAKKRETEAAKEAARERRRRQWANLLATAAMIGLGVAGWQYLIAKKATKVAEEARIEAENQNKRANGALRQIIRARREKITNQIPKDKIGGFFAAVQMNQFFLLKIDSLEKAGVEPSLILTEIESHLSKIEK
jgi:hypothetical protein